MTNTPARRKLREYFKSEGGMNQSALARALGCSQPSVSAWVKGEARPEDHYRRALERLIGLPAVEWLKPNELRTAFGTDPKTGTEG